LGAITSRDLRDHDADPGDHDAPIPVITLPRSQRSRCADLGDHDRAVRASYRVAGPLRQFPPL